VADYSAKIKLIVDGLQSLKQVEERVKNLNRLAAVDLGKALTGVKGFGSVKKEVDGVADSFSRLGKIVRGLAVGTGLGALTTSINGLSQAATALKFGGISKFAAALAAATGPAAGLFKELSNLAIQFPVVAGTATIAGAALLAFAPQVLRAGNATVRLGKAAAEAGQPLSRLMASLAGSGFRVDMFIDAAEATEIYRNRLYELSETVFVLSRRQASLKGTLDKFNSDSETAAKIAAKLVDVTKRLNAEQQAQNDLLREAAGLRPESVERRATNTYNVTQRRKAFELEQASDVEALNESLRRLESRQINWADALGIDAIEGAARNADRLSQAWAKNQQALTSWENALREGGQWLKELQASMRTDAADAYTRALLNQQRVLDTYADSAAQARRAVEDLGYRGEAPALRPAGFTDQDVRIKNMLDDQETAARTIFSIESEFNKKVHFTELDFIQKELEAEIDKIEAIGAAQKKADTAALKDFDARLKIRTEKSARRRQMTENVIIGGAFPMLFGGGPGAVLGGAAGGLIPGNPMLSVATSAVGALIDSFITSVHEAGSAIRDPITNFQKLADAGLIASRSQKQYIERLIEAGRVTEAAAAIQAELVQKIGAQGVKDLQNAGAASDSFNRKLAELNLQMQAAVAGPLTDLLTWLNNFLAEVTAYNRQQAAQTDFLTALRQANPQAYQQYFKESIQLREANRGVVDPQAIQRLQQRYVQQFKLQPGVVSSSVDKTPELQAKGQTQELAAQVQLEAQKLSLIGMSAEKDAQAYAVIAKRIAQQEYENKLLEIKNSWIGKAFDAERNLLLIRQANLQFAGKLKEIEVELSRASAKAAEDAERQYINRLQAEAALYKQAEQNLLFQVKIGQYVDDQRGGAEALLKNYDAIYKQRLAAFDTEREIALIEAARNGTTQETVQLYTYKLQLLNAEAGLEQAISQLVLDRLELEKKINLERSRVDAAQPFVELRREQELQLTASQSYLRLVMEGILPAEAERIVNFERLVAQQLQYNADQIKAVETQIVLTEATITEAQARGAAVDKLKEQLDVLKEQRAVIEGQAAQGPGEGPTDAQRAADALAQVRGELNQLADPINAAVTGANAIGSAFSQAFQGIATGTMTAQEALSSFFKSIGEAFVSMAAEIIAKQLVMITLQTILKALGAVAGGGGGTSPAPNIQSGGDFNLPGQISIGMSTAAKGAYWPGGFQAFADGGLVTKPTMGLIGEGGEPEYVIPQSKMSAAMSRYSRGARGESVIPGNGTSTEGGGTATAPMAPIDVRYSVERINNVDYVTADQFRAGMAQAAQQGAIQGERRAMRTLTNSAAARGRLGI
jgi:hypothetical protein